MDIVRPPATWFAAHRPWVFLAGSIEMGTAENWQQYIADNVQFQPGTLINPRREDWDSSWTQSVDNDKFREQVEWEMAALESADAIVLYLDPGTKSPISLMELGLHARGRRLSVCCPDGFWRKGNVEMVCRKYRVPLYHTLNSLLEVWRYIAGPSPADRGRAP